MQKGAVSQDNVRQVSSDLQWLSIRGSNLVCLVVALVSFAFGIFMHGAFLAATVLLILPGFTS
jgi:hypothetical protein